MGSEKLLLEITREQARVISEACECLARLHMGQLEEIVWLFGPKYWMVKSEADGIILKLKQVLFRELFPHGYHSIASPFLPDKARIAFDLHQVIRHHLAGPKPEGWFPLIYHDKPRQTSREQPLAVIKEISGKGD
ncbi:MAG: hypothetical protein JRG72_11170 [Deltaproteobacteria bacterium]|nr:hypothetical protein [Deltaproteobacteria bacterium]